MFSGIAAWVGLVTVGSTLSFAGPITPQFDSFGTLAAATFGGSGIPNNAVAITQFTDNGATITLGLTAHQRFGSPPVSNNGAGTFTVLAGQYPGAPELSLWNIGIYAAVEGGSFSDYQFELLYDSDPGLDTDDSAHGLIVNDGFQLLTTGDVFQTSQNLGFDFLRNDFVLPPPLPPITLTFAPAFPFDPSALGQYTFSLRAYDSTGANLLGSTSIAVNAVPEPSTLAIFAIGACGAAVAVRRRRRAAVASC